MNDYLRNQSGNVAIMAGIMIVLLFGLGGAAVDFIRFTTLRAELQSASDSAVLAAASLTNGNSPTVVASDYFDANFQAERFGLDNTQVSFNPVILENSQFVRTISSTATATLPTKFVRILGLFGGNAFTHFDITVNSQATEQEQNLEISLVLDVSGSMNGAKIIDLRTASDNFINQILDDSEPGHTSFNVIPFSSNVNIDSIFDTYADPALLVPPVVKPCLFYLPADFNSLNITTLRQPVDQATGEPISSPDRCVNTPALFNSDDRTELTNKVNSFVASGRTDAHVGLMWGVKALSPDLIGSLGGDFTDRPLAYGDSTLKVLVVMTDGSLNPYPIVNTATDFAVATTQFNDLCDEAKSNDIIVFSIGFQISAGSSEDTLLMNCATSLSNYFFVEGLDLQSAFDGIAASISRLRISE